MREQMARQIAVYWQALRAVTFDTSDKEDIYKVLGRAERLIAVLAAEIVALEAALTVREDGKDG